MTPTVTGDDWMTYNPVLQGRGPHDRPPATLCRDCTELWIRWRNHYRRYTTSNPTEWPGGAHIMDSRTSHAERRRTWIVKDAEQMAMVEDFCRRNNHQNRTLR